MQSKLAQVAINQEGTFDSRKEIRVIGGGEGQWSEERRDGNMKAQQRTT